MRRVWSEDLGWAEAGRALKLRERVRVSSSRAARASATLAAVASLGLAASASASASATPTITLYGGTGSAGAPVAGPATSSPLNSPQGTALDSSGNLYIVDASNNRIEKVTPSGTLSIIAGNGTYGTAVPGAATSSPLGNPQGVAVDGSGNVYIADVDNNEIEKVTPSGTLSIIAGTGALGTPTPGPATSSRLNGPMGVAVSSDGTVYIGDTENFLIEKVTPSGTLSVFAGDGTSGGAIAGPALSSPIVDPEAVSVDGAGDVYITDTGGNEIEKVTPGGTLSIFAGTGTPGPPTPGPAASSLLHSPEGVGTDTSGNVFIADCTNDLVEKVDPNGTLSIVAGNGAYAAPTYGAAPTASAFRCTFSVTAAPDGTLYVTDINYETIDRIGLATPGPPVQLSATAGDGSADLSFSPPTDLGTSAISGYQISLDGGVSWQPLTTTSSNGSLIAHLSGLSNGTTYPVAVRALNSAGAGATSAIATVTPPLPPTTPTTPPTTAPTTTAPTTTAPTTTAPPAAQADAVRVSDGALTAGLSSDGAGRLSVPLECPTVVSGICQASGTLSISIGASSANADVTARDARSAQTVIARFAGAEIQAGQTRLVATQLSPQAISYLRAHGIYRVRVTLRLSTTLTDGQSVTVVQHVWLYVQGLTGCHAATGTLSASGIGSLKLGMTRARAHRTGRYTRTHSGFERYCVAGGKIRVTYPSHALVHLHRARAARVSLALTSNPHYTIRGIRARMTVRVAETHRKLGRPIVIGKNAWYFLPGKHATRILKAQNGVIREIGVIRRSLAGTPSQDRYLMHHL